MTTKDQPNQTQLLGSGAPPAADVDPAAGAAEDPPALAAAGPPAGAAEDPPADAAGDPPVATAGDPPVATDGPENPAQIGEYKILRLCGAGGMGSVYAGWDADLGREVAIKVLLPELASQPAMA